MKASLFKRGTKWHAKIQLPTWPAERRESLGTTDKRIAQIELEKRLRVHEKVEAGILAPTSVREARQRALLSLCDAFLADIQLESCTLGTAKKYGAALRVVTAAMNWKTLAHVTENGLRAWRRDSTLRLETRNDYVAAWVRFGHWLKREKFISENFAANIEPMDTSRESREYRRALTEHEAMCLLATAPHPRNLFYRLRLETGIRTLELRRLRVADLRLGMAEAATRSPALHGGDRTGALAKGGLATAGQGAGQNENFEGVPPTCTPAEAGPCVVIPASIAKNRKTTVHALSDELAMQLVKLLPRDAHPSALAFPAMVPKCATFRRDLKAASIEPVDRLGRRVDLHSLRKTFGTHLVLAGAEPRVVMEAMRHSDLKLTMKTYTDAAQLAGPVLAAVRSLPWNRVALVSAHKSA